MPHRTAAAALAALALAAPALHAEQPAAPDFAPPNLSAEGLRSLALTCASCHGMEGRPAPGSSVGRLAGAPAGETAAKMKAFREGKRDATVMQQIAKGFGDAEIDALAGYFARQKP